MTEFEQPELWLFAAKRWNDPTLDANALADLLGVTPATVRQSLLVDPNFPAPQARGANGRNLWAPATIYPYVYASHPRRRDCIPRLWSSTPEPARFLGARSVLLRASERTAAERWVVHLWQPSDDRGPVAVGYPLNISQEPRRSRRQAVVDLFAELPGVTAAAVPRGDASLVALPGQDSIWQPAMFVVDTGTIGAENVQDRVVEYGWYELARLLGTDMPFWPTELRDQAAMLTWRPGDAVQRILPARGAYAPQPLIDLIAAAKPPMPFALRDIVNGLAGEITSDLAGSARSEAALYEPHPGLIHAAVAADDPDQPRRPRRRPGDIALVLHHTEADDKLAARALAAMNGYPVVTTTMTIPPELAQHPLIAGWLAGLRPVESSHFKDELGFRLLDRLRPEAQDRPTSPITQWCTHGRDPNVWVEIAEDGTVHTTVGSAVPAFGGQLAAVLVTDDCAFFETTHGETWPLPHKYLAGYNGGYDGSGPRDLTQTISRLLLDAAADVDDSDGRVTNDPRVWQAIRTQELPIELHFAS